MQQSHVCHVTSAISSQQVSSSAVWNAALATARRHMRHMAMSGMCVNVCIEYRVLLTIYNISFIVSRTCHLSPGVCVCVAVVCPLGQEYNGTGPNAVCQPCKLGYYKNTVSAAQCTQCPYFVTTAQTGSTNINQCLGACSAGFYSVWNTTVQQPQCVQCPLNTYKVSTTLLSVNCTKCPSGYFTLSTGSTDPSNCISKLPGVKVWLELTDISLSKLALEFQTQLLIECFVAQTFAAVLTLHLTARMEATAHSMLSMVTALVHVAALTLGPTASSRSVSSVVVWSN